MITIEIKLEDSDVFWKIFSLGLITALENDVLQPEECEVMLFNPYMKQHLAENGTNEHIIDIIDKGMELDAIKNFIPFDYNKVILRMKKECISCLKSNELIHYPIKRYFE